MNRRTISRLSVLTGALTTAGVLGLSANGALAGPPLLCHGIDIGNAQSLPWGSDPFAQDKEYDVKQVVDDTIKLLTPETPVFVHMETLRRATLYLNRDAGAADELLGRFMSRALDSEAAGKPDALAWFDAGYLAACYSQAGIATSFGPTNPDGRNDKTNPGYRWVARALTINEKCGEFALGAALILADHRSAAADFDKCLRSAFASGVMDTPSGKPIVTWIAQIRGVSPDDLRARYDLASARRNDH